ncbi:alpha-1,2-fucosyltransferase [Mucilaginibacter sp. cycad4]|uniref:alpha-1,2-fucosyltransferase n=1 Tax=Mucilaginibacter sp. cycad4 TaxID=3342096 RepID=UPI002AABD6F9|nr:alpha-1,2-fucosyltransferase [Mucilaginibacter gossypii]WPV02344.1 alpha-1,2-fucosyltransferase [Mucilaginibacter gossypii]
MDIVILYNGLGNQMSQYAFYLQKRHQNKSTYLLSLCQVHNGFELENIFNIAYQEKLFIKPLYLLFRILKIEKLKVISTPLKFLLKSIGFNVVSENFNYNFNENFLKPSEAITFYEGGWHSEKYFIDVKDSVIDSFRFTEPSDQENILLAKDILNSNSVCIHVRRGDYLDATNINMFGGVCTLDYFNKAIDYIKARIPNAHFFIFSNDIDWVKINLNIERVTYVTANKKANSWKDMYLMSICKHNIISNSTFSWWGAWLNKNEKKIVVCPNHFLKNDIDTDVYPSSWIRIKT